ncbi:MAG: metallophosphoesterase [Bacillota bacterium]|nr:metallophosphoesterase [Bacillota bacterium]
MKKFILTAIIILLIITLTGLLAFDDTLSVSVYRIKNQNVANKLTIVHISDLHSTYYGKSQEQLIQKIKDAKPDLIVLTGDIADDCNPFEGTKLLLEGIKSVAPIYYVAGNHEYWADNYPDIIKGIKEEGVKILSNDSEEINLNGTSILLYGVDDPESRLRKKDALDIKSALDQASEKAQTFTGLKILLSHRNEYYETYAKMPYDLVFSGHAHGGQVRIPLILPQGLVHPSTGFFPKYTGGEYKLSSTETFVVSRGLSHESLPRIFDSPQLIVVELYHG